MALMLPHDSKFHINLLYYLTLDDGPLQRTAELLEEAASCDRPFSDFLHYFLSDLFIIRNSLDRLGAQRISQCPPHSVLLLLSLLEDAVVDGVTQKPLRGVLPKLCALQARYTACGADKDKLRALAEYLDFGSKETRTQLLSLLELCAAELSETMSHGGNDAAWAAPNMKRKEPNYEFWKLNNQLSESFWTVASKCAGCDTPTTTIALCTHRNSMEELHFEAILSLNDTTSFDQEVRFTVHPKGYVASSIVYSRSLQVK